MKIELTKNCLKVGKWKCRNITIAQMKDYFKLSLHDIKGVTKRIPLYWDNYKKVDYKTDRPVMSGYLREQEIKILKLKKKIKVKNVEFIGFDFKLIGKKVKYGGESIKGKDSYSAKNEIGNYINFYKKGDLE